MKSPIRRVFDLLSTPLDKTEPVGTETEIDELYALCDDPMRYPVKLVDDELRFTDLARIQDLFVENTGFLVVGAVGLQGCGKSSLLNVLANQLTTKTVPLDGPFKVQTLQNLTTNSPETGGIDLYITQDRIILLDAQPLMSFALTNYHTRTATSASGGQMDISAAPSNEGVTSSTLCGPGGWSLDVWAEMASLQIVAFLLNCCHVVLVVSDDIINAPFDLHRLIDRAAGLKPTVYTPAVLPHCVQRRVQTAGTAPASHPANRQDCTSSVTDTSAGARMGAGPNTTTTAAAAATGVYGVSTDEEDDVEDDTDAGGLVSFGPERHRATRSAASDEPDVHVAPSGLLQPHHASSIIQRETTHQDAESSDVMTALNRLQGLTDYSASLIHVYNQAPSAAFLDPIVTSKLHTYQHQFLPMLYPETRRLASMVTLGPRILSAHLAASRRQNISVEKPLSPTEPINDRARDPAPTAPEDANPTVPRGSLLSATAVSGGDVASVSAVPAATSFTPSISPLEAPGASNPPSLPDEQRNLSESRHDKQLSSSAGSGDNQSEPEKATDENQGQKDQTSKQELHSELPDIEALSIGVTSNSTKSESPPIQRASQSSTGCNVVQDTQQTTVQVSTNTTVLPQTTTTTSMGSKAPHAPSEAELVAELRKVLQDVEGEMIELLKQPVSSSSSARRGPTAQHHSLADSSPSSESDVESDGCAPAVTDQLDGERLNARLARLTHRIQSIRRQFFDVQQRLNQPRLFLVPEVDEDGHAPTGCPSYAASVRVLQEAIMSTPRQHMMLQFTERKWIAYAQKMWEAVCNSPLFTDYHAILTNRV